jgi:hydrogenase expression/formation protein HypE
MMVRRQHITLAHGNGGRFMRELINDVFVRRLANPSLDVRLDAASVRLDAEFETLVTTDGFVVQPLEFPGGSIGTLAINGTVNDLAVSGATPRYITLGSVIEEGLEIATLERIVADLARAAEQANVEVVAGDTKVVPRGMGGGLYLSCTGVGQRSRDCRLSLSSICEDDSILVSGPVGDHAISVLLARDEFDLSGSVLSDCAAVLPLTLPLSRNPLVHFMRDPTRGGLATVAHDIADATAMDVLLDETAIPVTDAVRTVCEMLGYDPFHLACEGRVVAVVAADAADEILGLWRSVPGGRQSSRIGRLKRGRGQVILRTEIGGNRILEELEDDPLPRIC